MLAHPADQADVSFGRESSKTTSWSEITPRSIRVRKRYSGARIGAGARSAN